MNPLAFPPSHNLPPWDDFHIPFVPISSAACLFYALVSPNCSQTLTHSDMSVKHVHLIESSPALRAVQEIELRWDGKNGLTTRSTNDRRCPYGGWCVTMLVAYGLLVPSHLISSYRSMPPLFASYFVTLISLISQETHQG
jgi:hypothetical protein